MQQRDITYIIQAHRDYPQKPSNAYRKWDGKTPYYIHPLWCAATLAAETTLDEKTREEGVQALLYHDLLEDTTKLLPNWLSSRVKTIIEQMTFEQGSAQEMQEIWNKPDEIKLYKLYDKVSNLLDGNWMSPEKKKQYRAYTQRLCDEVEKIYGQLNITQLAKTMGVT